MTKAAQLDSATALARPELWAAANTPFLPWGEGTDLLATYMDLLLKWNNSLNLSACHDVPTLLRILIQDSFFLAQFLEKLNLPPHAQIVDLGAGAGLPGLPLRIFWQRGHYTLVELAQKRAIFLQNALARLVLPRTDVAAADAAIFLRKHPAGAHLILSRAFKPWPDLLPLCAPALAKGAHLVIMANDPPPQTLPTSWQLTHSQAYELPQAKKRHLWALTPGITPCSP